MLSGVEAPPGVVVQDSVAFEEDSATRLRPRSPLKKPVALARLEPGGAIIFYGSLKYVHV